MTPIAEAGGALPVGGMPGAIDRGMTRYPVQLHVAPPGACSRLQLAARVVAFAAFGLLGVSFGAVFGFAYLALPAYVASRGAAPDIAAPIVRALRWFAAVSAWVGLVADRLPARSPDETVTLVIDAGARPPARGVLIRVITGLPSAIALAVLCWIGVFVWLWAAMTILIAQRIGPSAFAYLTGLQRWSVRLLAYQAGLVDAYPPFRLGDDADRRALAAA
jgi:hypothetical protein